MFSWLEGSHEPLADLIRAPSAPSATFAALVNPTIISILVLTNGAFIPYSQMQEFWKYWLCKLAFIAITKIITSADTAIHF
jgi:hypothetical protein